MFDTFKMYTVLPSWDLSSCDMMRKYSWTRLAWCNQRKVAAYLAALDIRNPFGETCLGVLVLTPGACAWADSVDFSELLTYFGTIVHSCIEVDPSCFTEYAAYAMAMFIDDAFEEHGDTVSDLIDCLNVTNPGSGEPASGCASIYQELLRHFKEPPLDHRYVCYYRMMSCCYRMIVDRAAFDKLRRLTWGDIHKKADVFFGGCARVRQYHPRL